MGDEWKSRAATVAAALMLAVVAMLSVFRSLSLVMPSAGLDGSWIAFLGEAALRPARWGVDLAFTYGPASALVTRYFTDDYLATIVPFALALACVEGLAFALLVRRAAERGRFSGAAVLLPAAAVQAAALATQAAPDQVDSFVFTVVLTVAFLDLVRRPGGRTALGTVLIGSALLGATAIAKTSFGIAAIGVLAIADARALLADRRPPILTPVALLGALSCFLLFGQRIGDLPAYLRLQIQEATGYGEAMYLEPGRLELSAYLCGSAALAAVAALCGVPGHGGRIAAAFATSAVLLLGLKAGFVRADVHTQIAWSLLGLAGVAVAAALVLPRSGLGAVALAASSLAVLWIVCPLTFLAATDRRPSLAALPAAYADIGRSIASETDAWARLVRDPRGFIAAARADKAAAWAVVRAAQPLPPLTGRVDILPSEQAAVLANNLDYSPRPSFQDYSTYAPALAAANAAFYEGPDAPDWVIFDLGGLDGRAPTMTEGELWPDLLRRYEPQRRIDSWIMLHRRAVPLPDVLGPPRHVAARLDGMIDLPGGAGPTFARVLVHKTLLGRLAALLFRPPPLCLRIVLADGDERSYRFIPALGEAGFLLSPDMDDSDAFAALAFGRSSTKGHAVAAMAIVGPRWASLFYERDVSVELRSVSVPAVPPSAEARALADGLAASRP